MSCALPIFGAEFTPADIQAAVDRRGLLSMEIEVGTACNFRCRYCYVESQSPGDTPVADELSDAEIRDAVRQAKALGARKIILLGGEPMLYEFTLDLCAFLRAENLDVEVFTNGTNMTAAAAARLFQLGVHVVLKWNSSNPATQDWLAAFPGASAIIGEAYKNLRAAGYPGDRGRLALSTVMCRQNREELPALWTLMRREGIEPYFEMITPQGRARDDHALELDPDAAHDLFRTLQKIDREQFNRTWEPQPPLVGNVCLRHSYSCLVNAAGEVMPCVGVQVPLGNIRKRPLGDILRDSDVLEDLRDHPHTIQGACADCEKIQTCYGCRGAAFQLTRNYLGSDPLCWRNTGAADLGALPMPAGDLLPHQPPVRMIETLDKVGERTGCMTAVIRPDNPFLGPDGRLDEAAHAEIMAQAAAALDGFRMRPRRGAPRPGLLTGLRNLTVHTPIAAGDRLRVEITKSGHFGSFGILNARIRRQHAPVSEGELKVWHAP